MRIEKIRKLVWFGNVVLGLALAWYAFTLFTDSGPKYRYIDDLKSTSATRGSESPQIERAKVKSWYDVLLSLPISGERPAPDVDIVPTEVEDEIDKSAVAQIADLIEYAWSYLDTPDGPQTTDDSKVHLKLKKQGDKKVWIQISDPIPGTAWTFVDLIVDESAERAKAVFTTSEGEDAGKPHSLDFAVSKSTGKLPSTRPGDDPSGGGSGTGAGGTGTTPGGLITLDEIPTFPETQTRFTVPRREREYLKNPENQANELKSIKSVSWKDPDTGLYAGIQIKKIERRTYAYKRGVRSGDIIVSINGKPVTGRAGVIKYLKSDEGKDQKQYVVIMRTATGADKRLVYNVDDK